MLAAFLLGLTGSLGHCAGMCSGISLMLGRRTGGQGRALLLVHVGRVTSYTVLGIGAGALGRVLLGGAGPAGSAPALAHAEAAPGVPLLAVIQGGLALVTAVVALYMALALLGRAPSPERFFIRLTRHWGRRMQQATSTRANHLEPGSAHPAIAALAQARQLVGLGLLWGLLPCGLVLAGLLLAGAAGGLWRGGLAMAAFGLGTLPVPFLAGLAGGRVAPRPRPALRPLAAALIAAFGLQMALRGLAAWGAVGHLDIAGLMLW